MGGLSWESRGLVGEVCWVGRVGDKERSRFELSRDIDEVEMGEKMGN